VDSFHVGEYVPGEPLPSRDIFILASQKSYCPTLSFARPISSLPIKATTTLTTVGPLTESRLVWAGGSGGLNRVMIESTPVSIVAATLPDKRSGIDIS